jgi:hypothetical protein
MRIFSRVETRFVCARHLKWTKAEVSKQGVAKQLNNKAGARENEI